MKDRLYITVCITESALQSLHYRQSPNKNTPVVKCECECVCVFHNWRLGCNRD